jgi:WD40 repeat protein
VLATADADGVLKLWDSQTGAEQATLAVYAAQRPLGPSKAINGAWFGGANYVTALAFSPDGKVLVAAGLHGVKLWDVPKRLPLPPLQGKTDNHVLCAYSRDGTLLATGRGMVPGIGCASGGGGNDITLWDAATGSARLVLSAHGYTPTSLALAPDNRTIATGGTDGQIKLWSIALGGGTGQLVGPHLQRFRARLRHHRPGPRLRRRGQDRPLVARPAQRPESHTEALR